MAKCPKCDGSGIIMYPNSTYKICNHCDGSGQEPDPDRFNAVDFLDAMGKVKQPQTNEDWLCSLPTEEKAKFLKEATDACATCLENEYDLVGKCPFGRCRNGVNEFVDWLREKHGRGKDD